MSQLSAELILNIQDLAIEEVDVPEWSAIVRVRELTATERNQIGLDFVSPNGEADASRMPPNFHGRIASICLVDEDGKRLFTDEDADALGAKSSSALERIVGVCFRLSGLSSEGVEDVKGASG
jgi:hypothetical protein